MVKFESKILFGFENFGKTPGIVKELRADLFVLQGDTIPTGIDLDLLATAASLHR